MTARQRAMALLRGVAAAVDVEDRTMDEAGLVAGQVADGGGDLFRRGWAPGGDQVAWFHDPDGNTLSLTTFTGA